MRLTISKRLYVLVGIFCIGLAALAVTLNVKSASNLREQKAAELNSLVDAAVSIIKGYDEQVIAGSMSLHTAQLAAANAIRSMRYRGNEYFFITDFDSNMVMHAAVPALEGSNQAALKDVNGVAIIGEMIETVKADGAGYLEYVWARAGSEILIDKLSYFKGYEPWNWIVGTGVYVDDVSAILWSSTQVMMIVGGLIMLICTGFAWVTLRAVLNPMNALKKAMSELANGQILTEIPALDRKDEFGEMATTLSAFNKMTEERKNSADDQERSQGDQAKRQQVVDDLIQNFREEAASGLDMVADNMTRLQATAGELNDLSKSTAGHSNKVQESASTASNNVQTVAATTEEFTASISEIGRQVEQATSAVSTAMVTTSDANDRVGSLSQAAQQIGNVISLIQDIAEQTNLLALNATIEAARAGEMGKGFAVVASEVKELAKQTSNATDQISEQVSMIQHSTEDAVQSIDEIGTTIEQVNTFTSAIAEAVQQQNLATSEIANSIHEAATSTLAVSSDIEVVFNSVTQTNVAVDEVNTVSADVSKCANGLAETVDQFLKRVVAA